MNQQLTKIEQQYKEKCEQRKAKIRQEPKKFKRFFKWCWYYMTFMFIWLFYNMRDRRSAVCILIAFTFWSGSVWVPALLGFMFHNNWLIGLAGSIWLWWLSPFGSPFLELVVLTSIGLKALDKKIRSVKIMMSAKKKFRALTLESKALYLVHKHMNGEKYRRFEKIAFTYFDKGHGVWVAVDNRDGDCYVEEFNTRLEAYKYLYGENYVIE